MNIEKEQYYVLNIKKIDKKSLFFLKKNHLFIHQLNEFCYKKACYFLFFLKVYLC
ncbi:hypothetical protein CLAVI_000230 [Candidatus Clavichlamydia salmonicola]|nr:hypothetical protein [Candidatus Clavichlamydia salmonicola]